MFGFVHQVTFTISKTCTSIRTRNEIYFGKRPYMSKSIFRRTKNKKNCRRTTNYESHSFICMKKIRKFQWTYEYSYKVSLIQEANFKKRTLTDHMLSFFVFKFITFGFWFFRKKVKDWFRRRQWLHHHQ